MGRGQSLTTERRGSSASDKQIAYAVREYLLVTFSVFPGSEHPPVTGWVMGADDYHWVVYTRDGSVALVHKTCPLVEVGRYTVDLDSLPGTLRGSVLSRVEPYRQWVLTHVFSKSPSPAN